MTLQELTNNMTRDFRNKLLGEETIILYLEMAFTLGEKSQIEEQLLNNQSKNEYVK